VRSLPVVLLATFACGAEVRPGASTRSAIAPDGGLTRAAVDEVVRAHLSTVRGCYEKFAAAEHRPMGVVRLAWRVASSGEVSSVMLVASTLHSAPIEACIADDVGRWQFPSSARDTEITDHPFSF
jgi:hypothetical protein